MGRDKRIEIGLEDMAAFKDSISKVQEYSDFKWGRKEIRE